MALLSKLLENLSKLFATNSNETSAIPGLPPSTLVFQYAPITSDPKNHEGYGNPDLHYTSEGAKVENSSCKQRSNRVIVCVQDDEVWKHR